MSEISKRLNEELVDSLKQLGKLSREVHRPVCNPITIYNPIKDKKRETPVRPLFR